MNIYLKSSEELDAMRQGAKILKAAHEAVKKEIRDGVSLLELDKVAEDTIRSLGGVPAFKGYQGFPATLCTMPNSEVVHGIPDDRKLVKGDLLSVDCGVIWKELYTDSAFTVVVGGDETNPERAKFSACVKKALLAGCAQAKAGNTVGDIGAAVQEVVEKGGYSICREYTGHGLGTELWEDPHVYNYGPAGKGTTLQAGMTIAIEPIVSSGSPKVKTLKDGWTVVTLDGKDACQWEHCGVVGDSGFEILV